MQRNRFNRLPEGFHHVSTFGFFLCLLLFPATLTAQMFGGQIKSVRGSIASLDCNNATNSGTLTEGTTASGVTSGVPYTGGNGGPHNGQMVNSTGVTGLTAILAAGSFASGSGTLTYTIAGTPNASGTASFDLSIGGATCTFSIAVINGSYASCGEANVHNPLLNYGIMTDQEGNVYKTIVIGTQEWMAENLKTSIYRNGDLIPNITDATAWSELNQTETGAWAHFDNNAAYECPYGKLYNWYAVDDPRNLCPVGWHVPTDAEWTIMITYLDPDACGTCTGNSHSAIAGGKMKSAGTIESGTGLWIDPNTGATNESGFSGAPGRARGIMGQFIMAGIGIGYSGEWWSATTDGMDGVWLRQLNFEQGVATRTSYLNKRSGNSVRCLRD